MAQPVTGNDTVLYTERNFHADKNVELHLLDGSYLAIWGPVYVNGVLVSGGGGGTVSDVMWVGPSAPTDPNIEIWWDSDETSSGEYMYDVKTYGAIGNGIVDDTAAIQSAYAAANAIGGGIVFLPAGTYLYSSNLIFNSNVVSVQGVGSDAVTLQASGTAKILIERATFTVDQGPTYSGFTVRGATGSPANAIGIHATDIVAATWKDLTVEGFTGTGSIGMLLDNRVYWTERNQFSAVWLNNNKIGVKCTLAGGNTSFGFNRWLDLRMNVYNGQIGMQVANAAFMYTNDLNIICNVVDAGVVIDLTGPGASLLIRGRLFLTAEQTSGTGGIGVRVAAGCLFSMLGHRSLNGLTDVNNNVLSNGGTQYGTLRQMSAVAGTLAVPQALDGGVKTSFLGAESARMVPLVGDDIDNLYAGMGVMVGANIASVYFTMYNYNGNGCVFYAVPASGSHGDGIEVARITNQGAMKCGKFTTALRPSASGEGAGAMIYDTTLSKPVWSNGTVWKDASGATV